MADDIVIRIENLGKQYRIGRRQSHGLLSQRIAETITKPFFGLAELFTRKPANNVWALRNVSFDIKRGEVIGVIGRNGSGKTTLLKILSSVTEPTEGRAEVRGRSASLLEVGTGFHPDLTGRENVYLNGIILGMRRSEIDASFDEIVRFSEIEEFIDTPVKRYSSGMAVRLAFSVAAHLQPEILMIDEILAVGDLKFQRKCLEKMNEVVGHGKTILFVTHQMNAVRRLCTKCVWIEDGAVKMIGPTPQVVSAYETASFARAEHTAAATASTHSQFIRWSVKNESGHDVHLMEESGPFILKLQVKVHKEVINGDHGIALWNASDELMWGYAVQNLNLAPGLHEFTYKLPSLPLRPGSYRWQASLWNSGELLDEWYAVPELIIATEPVTHPSDDWSGILNIPCEFGSDSL